MGSRKQQSSKPELGPEFSPEVKFGHPGQPANQTDCPESGVEEGLNCTEPRSSDPRKSKITKRTARNRTQYESRPPSNPDFPAIVAVNEAMRIAIEQKGLDVCALELAGRSDLADYFVIISATSDRHAQGIAEKIRLHCKLHGEEPNSINGFDSAEWILLDYGDYVVHIFYEPTRQYYAFDELWKGAKFVALGQELEQQARRLRTGMIRCQSSQASI